MKSKLIIPTVALLMCCCLCCTSKSADEQQEGVQLSQVKLNLKSPIECKGGQTLSCSFISGYGPLATDEIVLRRESMDDVVLPIKSVEQTSFSYTLPKQFDFDTYSFCLRRDGALRGFGKVTYVLEGSQGSEDQPIGPEEGSTVWGLVSCDGKGIPGVVVSDGVEVVVTDSRGVYQMASKKEIGYVFISVPSGYEAASIGVLPQLHKQLTKSSYVCERVDFIVYESGDQTKHTMLYFGDMHMANRTKDRSQFLRFTSEINEYMKANPGAKIYALTLGDMTWDLYWYSNAYSFDEYLKDMNVIEGLQVFHTIGNHDHDMNATGDFYTAARFREKLCPNYYSFNVGDIHYVVLDDIECTNASASMTDGGVRSYKNNLTSEMLAWLKKDLSFVPKTTPLVVALHAPVHDRNGNANLGNNAVFLSLIYDYNTTIVSGHSHVLYNVVKSNYVEHNNGAICAAWWWAGKYNPTFNIGTDGTPNGYRITSVNGKEQTSLFKAIGRPDSYQFRAYDRNSICINAANYGVLQERESILFEEDYGSYRTASSANEVIVNVWDWDPSWKVEMFEDGKALSVSQMSGSYDPAFLIAYTIPRLLENNGVTWHSSKTNHLFKAAASSASSTVEIKVTDDEGRVYTQTMQRPLDFKVDNYK